MAKAEHLEVAFAYLALGAPDHSDLQIVCLFYAALHYIDAALHHINALAPAGHRRSHRFRANLARLNLGRDVADDFEELQNRSEEARYGVIEFLDVEVASLHAGEFDRIRSHVRTALGLPQEAAQEEPGIPPESL